MRSRATKASLTARALDGELALDLAGLVDLQDVALLDVRVVLENDAALEAGGDLADVVVEAPQAADRGVVDDRAVAHDPHLGAAADDAVGDVRAGDRADARGAEGLAHLDGPDGLLDLLGLEHALHRVAQIVERLVDDRVGADLDALAVGDRGSVADRPHVEAEYDSV